MKQSIYSGITSANYNQPGFYHYRGNKTYQTLVIVSGTSGTISGTLLQGVNDLDVAPLNFYQNGTFNVTYPSSYTINLGTSYNTVGILPTAGLTLTLTVVEYYAPISIVQLGG